MRPEDEEFLAKLKTAQQARKELIAAGRTEQIEKLTLGIDQAKQNLAASQRELDRIVEEKQWWENASIKEAGEQLDHIRRVHEEGAGDRYHNERVQRSHERAIHAARHDGKAIIKPSSWVRHQVFYGAFFAAAVLPFLFCLYVFDLGQLGIIALSVVFSLIGLFAGSAAVANIFVEDESLELSIFEHFSGIQDTVRRSYFK